MASDSNGKIAKSESYMVFISIQFGCLASELFCNDLLSYALPFPDVGKKYCKKEEENGALCFLPFCTRP